MRESYYLRHRLRNLLEISVKIGIIVRFDVSHVCRKNVSILIIEEFLTRRTFVSDKSKCGGQPI